MPQHLTPAFPATGAIEPEYLDQLRGDGARMAPHWTVTVAAAPTRPVSPVAASRIRGITVPATSADLLAGMSDYGD
ncbi:MULTISPECIES: hypothetical protein [Streptomyces]|uniref:Uncharacterized protein n=1 Tax=Streptomyces rhizosphaericus TaxID=114699 RepID=A0A6G4ANL3_9ACTN|nr:MULTISPECIES: hypothetical protein [Streptomyces]MBA6435347.1 hypothetical protein [Streptomyces sp. GMR22]MBI0379734.1 hypothetical protein [Streptomyces albiflaviniger]NEW74374.1 hypothetical protein [Streptomyces rhizosphaericus]